MFNKLYCCRERCDESVKTGLNFSSNMFLQSKILQSSSYFLPHLGLNLNIKGELSKECTYDMIQLKCQYIISILWKNIETKYLFPTDAHEHK